MNLSIALSEVATVLFSVLGSAFLAGLTWGRYTTELREVNRRLANIEGMFQLTPRKQLPLC